MKNTQRDHPHAASQAVAGVLVGSAGKQEIKPSTVVDRILSTVFRPDTCSAMAQRLLGLNTVNRILVGLRQLTCRTIMWGCKNERCKLCPNLGGAHNEC